MKSLKQLLEASLLDIDTNLDITDSDIIKDAITQFINDNYDCKKFTISDKSNKDGKYEVSTKHNVAVKNKNITLLTNDLFVWNEVGGDFYCHICKSLQSLEGAPKEVGGDFYCHDCKSLQSLKGSPKEVRYGFYCYDCESLQSLEGAPKKVGSDFNCSGCRSLKSLEGAPKEVKGDFDCYYCEVQFKESDIRNICDIKGKIYV